MWKNAAHKEVFQFPPRDEATKCKMFQSKSLFFTEKDFFEKKSYILRKFLQKRKGERDQS
jgi:hypothetical protein